MLALALSAPALADTITMNDGKKQYPLSVAAASNRAVFAVSPPPETETPIPSASDDEKASCRIMFG